MANVERRKAKMKILEKRTSKDVKLKNNQMSEGRHYYEQPKRPVSMNERKYRMAEKRRKLECADVEKTSKREIKKSKSKNE